MTTTSEPHADRETEAAMSNPDGLHRLLMGKSHPGESHFGSATYNEVSVEDCDAIEATIRADERKRIAEEVIAMRQERAVETGYDIGWWAGVTLALRIIERGTGVAGEGEG